MKSFLAALLGIVGLIAIARSATDSTVNHGSLENPLIALSSMSTTTQASVAATVRLVPYINAGG